MRAAADRALADGAWGMSTGLVYPPGSYAGADEVVAVGAGLAAVGGLYASHIRNENDGLAERWTRPSRSAAVSASGSRSRISRRPAGTTTVARVRRSRSSTARAPPACGSTRMRIHTRPAARF